MRVIKLLNWTALLLLIHGAISAFAYAVSGWNMLFAMFGGVRNAGAIAWLVLYALSMLWLVISLFITHGRIAFWDSREDMERRARLARQH